MVQQVSYSNICTGYNGASNDTQNKTFKSNYNTYYQQPVYNKKARSGIVAGGILSGIVLLNSIIFRNQLTYKYRPIEQIALVSLYTGCGALVDYLRNNKAPNQHFDKTDTGKRVGAWLGMGVGLLTGFRAGILGAIASIGVGAAGGWIMGMISDHFAYKNNK